MIYQFLKQIIKVSLFFFFKKIVTRGKEHIPDKGPLILVANHPNTFMDPLLIAAVMNQRIGFIANAGIFLNKFVSRILAYFHVIPIYRKKDIQPGEKPDNRKAFVKCHDYLGQQGAILIFPEGSSYYELKLREIKTGTARIALSYEELKGFTGNLKIIPIALDYSDSIQFRSMVSVTVCPAIRVDSYKEAYEQNDFDAVLQLTEDIRKVLVEKIPQTSGKEQEQFLLRAHQFYTSFYAPKADLNLNPKQSLDLRNRVSKAMAYLYEENAELYHDTQAKLLLFFKLLKEEKITPLVINNNSVGKKKILVYLLYVFKFILLFPFYIIGLLANYVPYLLTAKIFRALKLDISYRAPVQMITGMLTFPLYYMGLIWLFKLFLATDLWTTLLLLLIMPVAGYISMYYYTEIKRFARLCRYDIFMTREKKELIATLKDDIINNMDEARRKLGLSEKD